MNAFYERIDKAARRLLEQSQALALPVNLDAIADFLGFTVLTKPLEEEYSGFLAVAEKTIVVNSQHSPVRRRFTAAHEIGHYQLHRKKKPNLPAFIDRAVYFRRASGDDGNEVDRRMEMEANAFAAGLLMPECLLEEYLDKHPDVDLGQTAGIKQMADEFDVSRPAMEYRLRNLGFLLPTSF